MALLATWWFGRRAVPQYQSSATIRVDSKRGVFGNLTDIDIAEMSLRTDPVLSEALVLSTQALGFAVADAVGMQVQFQPGTQRTEIVYNVQVDSLARPDSFEIVRRTAGYELRNSSNQLVASGPYENPAVGPGFSFMVRPAEQDDRASFAIISRVTAADLVRGGLGYNIQPNTNIVTVTYTGTDASIVPHVLDWSLRALQQSGVQRIQDVAEQRLAYIEDRVEEARSRYLTALSRLQGYQEEQNTTDLTAEEVALINQIAEQDRARESRRLDVATMRGIMSGTAGRDTVVYETVNRLAAVAAIQSNPAMQFQLENLMRLYEDRREATAGGVRETNPQVRGLDARIAQASRSLIDAANAMIRSMESQLASIDSSIRVMRERLSTYPGKQTQFAQLELETSLQNETYKYLLSQLEAARIQRATIAPYVSVVEPARPASRIGMGLRQKMMLGLLAGLALSILAAFFLEYLDQTIKTSADVERALEVPVLGLIPLEGKGQQSLPNGSNGVGRRRQSLPLVSLMSPENPASEAYRTLRTNVTFVNAEQRHLQLIVVTSPGPGEGKSTTAANLAITLAQQGSRTLLVDADLRRPLVHRAFNLVQEPGLTDVLIGTAQVREAIRPNVVPKLDVLPAGALPPNPSELLGSDAMRSLLEQLRAQYEIIIFDSPPTLAVTDATVLGASSDAVILVVRAGETEEVAAQRALQQLRRVQARVAGTVLNGIRKDRDRYYNYYSYYRGDRSDRERQSHAGALPNVGKYNN